MCRECGEVKPLSDFYPHKAMADGHLNKCKPCVKARVGKHRESNIEAIQAYDRKRGRTEERKAENAKHRDGYKAKHIERSREWRKRNPEKYKAHTALNNAVRDGKVTKGLCGVCGSADVEAHHEDYTKPFEVQWLCVVHHGHTRRID